MAWIAALLLSACASIAETKPGEPFKTQAAIEADHLKPVNLLTGECGLFIWTADDARRFILFHSETTKAGRWLHDGEEVALRILSTSVSQAGAFTYETATGLRLDLTLTRREAIDGGVRYKSGTISHKSDEAWERVEPVVGLQTCQPP